MTTLPTPSLVGPADYIETRAPVPVSIIPMTNNASIVGPITPIQAPAIISAEGPPISRINVQPAQLSQYERDWRARFPKKVSLVLGMAQFVMIGLIAILEIASLAVAVGARPTGVGIWTAIPFSIAAVLKIGLGMLLVHIFLQLCFMNDISSIDCR